MEPLSRFEMDELSTSLGPLKIHFLGHASLLFVFRGLNIYIDPFSRVADFSVLPKADILLITHEHSDHFDLKAINQIKNEKTRIILNESSAKQFGGGIILHNEEETVVEGLKVKAVAAYNVINKKTDGQPWHAKGNGNGYILSFGDKTLYAAGDTENIPEMKNLRDIDFAFLPMNLQMVADAAASIKPGILYPYHYGDTKMEPLITLMQNVKGVELRIRKM